MQPSIIAKHTIEIVFFFFFLSVAYHIFWVLWKVFTDIKCFSSLGK